jgi:WD40 repeat protein
MIMGSPVGRIAFQTEAQSIAWSPDGNRLAVAINEGRKIALVDARSGQSLWTADARGDLIRSVLRFSADGSSIYIAADRRAESDALADVLTIVSARDGTVVRRFRYNGATDRPQRAGALAVDEGRGRILATPDFPGDKLLAFAGTDAPPVVLAEWPIVLGPDTVPARSFSPAHVAVDGPRDRLWWARGGMLRLLRLSDVSLQRELQAFETYIEALQIHPRNGEIIVGGRSMHREDEATRVRAFDPQTGKLLRNYVGPGGTAYGLSVSPDGRYLAAARGYSFDEENQIQSATNFSIWDAASGKLMAWRTFGEEWVHDVAFDPSGNRIAVAVDKGVQIFRIQP